MSQLISDLNSSRLVTEDPDTVDDAVALYNTVLQDLLEKNAPISSRSIAEREPQPWISEDILSAKRDRRSTEKMWRKSNLTVHKLIYKEKCEIVKELIQKSKSKYFLSKITQCEGDQKKLFGIVDSLLGRGKPKQLPTRLGPLELAHAFNDFFVSKISTIRENLEVLEPSTSDISFDLSACLHPSLQTMSEFSPCSDEEVKKLIINSSKATCQNDPLPSSLLTDLLDPLVPVIKRIVNMSLASGHFPSSLKSAIVKPLLKKSSLDPENYKNFRPVSNLPFLSKVIEKIIAAQLHQHMSKNNLLDKMQSAYKCGHSTETALLRVQNDLLQSIDKGKCVYLILLDLSAAFDTVDHNILLTFL